MKVMGSILSMLQLTTNNSVITDLKSAKVGVVDFGQVF